MKIIEQSHEILSHTGIDMVERAGRNCYQSEPKGCGLKGPVNTCLKYTDKLADPKCDEKDCRHHTSHKFVKMLRDKGHHAMLEFGEVTVKFITDRGVMAELTRHRMGVSFAIESTRYVKYDGEMEFIKPVWCSNHVPILINGGGDIQLLKFDEQLWTSSMAKAENTYKALLNCGWKAQQARSVLPNSLKTEIICKANFREWLHILKLRCSTKSHPQMASLMRPLLVELQEKLPVVFDDLVF